MKKKVILWSVYIFIFICFYSCNNSIENSVSNEEPIISSSSDTYAMGEIIVKLNSLTPISEIDALVPGIRVKTIASLNEFTLVLYHLFNESETENTINLLKESGKVIYAEKNAVYSLCLYQPDDPYYNQFQYSPKVTQCDEGWEIEKGSSSVIVAVIDSGINGLHEDLTGRVIAGKNIITGTDIAAAVNSDENGHGTHVAGIIGAMGNNGKGIAGVAWYVQLMPVKVFGTEANTTTALITEGLIWAIDHGARVINMSLGGTLFSMAVNDAVNYAYENNVVVVAAMGNDSQNKIKFPAAMPGVIAVGSSNGKDEVSYFSTQGNHISVVAPGESIYSLKNTSNTEYRFLSGTSMATPFVAGVAALLLSHYPQLIPDQVRSMLEDNADPLGPEAFSKAYGYGRVNVYKVLSGTISNKYGSITVNVTNKDKPLGGVKVVLQNTADGSVVQAGLTSYGGTTGGVNGQINFHGVRLGSYTVRVQVGTPQAANLTLFAENRTESVDFAFNSPMVLLVNAVKKTDTSLLTDEFLYTQKLTRMDKYFTTWKIYFNGPPSSELLKIYDLVIWFTGRTEDDPANNIEVMTSQETAVIKDYLDNGGRLYLCGNNLAEHLTKADHTFLTAYLHSHYDDSPLPDDQFLGQGLLNGMTLFLSAEDDDSLILEPDASGILYYADEADDNHWIGLSWAGNYRLVFTTMTPNEIIYCNPNTFFENIINWLEQDN